MGIKVRAWDEFKQRMFNPNKLLLLDSSHKLDCVIWDPKGMLHSCPLMIYTGLEDTNQREIFFGDVYYVAGYGNLHIEDIGDVVTVYDALAEKELGKYLGNIHENPELLEKQ